MSDPRHTPEPWVDSDDDDCTHQSIRVDDFVPVARVMDAGDYRRARLCVNALAGVPTDALESILAQAGGDDHARLMALSGEAAGRAWPLRPTGPLLARLRGQS